MLKPISFYLLVLLAWLPGICFVVDSFRSTQQWEQFVSMGFGDSPAAPNESVDVDEAPITKWQQENQQRVEEDHKIISESWGAFHESGIFSLPVVEGLGTVIRRNLDRMHSRIDTCLPCCEICHCDDSNSTRIFKNEKVNRSSQLSHYLQAFHQQVQKREIEDDGYLTSRKNWSEAGETFCCRITGIKLTWRDLDRGVQSTEKIHEDQFATIFSGKLQELEAKGSKYFEALSRHVAEMWRVSSKQRKELHQQELTSILVLILIAVATYLAFVFKVMTNESLDSQPVHGSAGVSSENFTLIRQRRRKRGIFPAFTKYSWPGFSEEDIRKKTPLFAGLKCLLIEDNEEGRKLVIENLKTIEVGCDAVETNEGLTPALVEDYDLLISDVMLAEGVPNGVQFTESIRRQGCTVPVLLISAHMPSETMRISESQGVVLGMRKPLDRSKLISAISHLVELAGLKSRADLSETDEGISEEEDSLELA